jgi:hypothetical protein
MVNNIDNDMSEYFKKSLPDSPENSFRITNSGITPEMTPLSAEHIMTPNFQKTSKYAIKPEIKETSEDNFSEENDDFSMRESEKIEVKEEKNGEEFSDYTNSEKYSEEEGEEEDRETC